MRTPIFVPRVALLCLLAGKTGAASVVEQGNPASSPPSQIEIQSELNQAYQLLRDQKLEAARAAFARLVESDPENRTARLELGYLNGRLGLWKEAVKCLEAVSQREPENLRLRLDLGYALEHSGELERAMEEFQVVAQQPGEYQAQARAALESVRQLQVRKSAPGATESPSKRDEFLNRGYTLLREGKRSAAQREFERALAEDPANVTVMKQLGYLALEEGNPGRAVEYFESAWQRARQDYALALQLGFVYDRLHESRKAEAAFREAAASPDAQVHKAAETALKNVRSGRPRGLYLDVFTSPLYASRFTNAIASYQGQLGWRPRGRGPLSIYLGTRFTRDSRSQGGNLPAIFSDNVALAGLGVSVRPRGSNLNLQAEANLAFNLVRRPHQVGAGEPDFRVTLAYYHRWDSRLGLLGGVLTRGRFKRERLFSDLDTSLGYYSRFQDNVIGYLQLREGMRLLDLGPSRLSGYFKLNLAKDTNRDFFNNVGEGGVGLELRPFRNQTLSVRGELLRGVYYGMEGRDPNPYRPNYTDVRITLLFGRRF